MSIINNLLNTLIDRQYYSYPGLFKKQKHAKYLDLDFDLEYTMHIRESLPRKYDLDNINI